MNKSNWHRQEFNCPKCDRAVGIQEMAFSAEGAVLVAGVCSRCEEIVSVVYLWEDVIVQCLYLDGISKGTIQKGNDFIN